MSDVLLVVDADPWRTEAERALKAAGANVSFAARLGQVSLSMRSQAKDGVLVDLDLFRPSERVELIERLTHSSPAPAIAAWSTEVTQEEAFELGRQGVRTFRRSRPSPTRVVDLMLRALDTHPVLEPRLRAMVGRVTQSEMLKMVRETLRDQALGAARGNKTHAGRLLRISRQSLHQRGRDIEEAS